MVRARARVSTRMRAEATTTINTRAYETGLRRWFGGMSADVAKAVDRTRIDVQNEARRRAPVDTGRLRSSIVSRVEGGGRSLGYAVGTNVSYAADVEYGTAPHVIKPKDKKALFWPGAAHPVAQVNHPGTAPRPFLRPAIELTPIFWRAHASQIGRR
ncbi:HK97 gp10 family phage protein [Streptomyces acidiscabies]|uniref:HK97 gp10 family phage protein n=1 Tax=Streptomyces acidiscabies TaxID=42234 RepID=A0AAP6BCU6_9ACTN|nr:HK97 gp10 family phage protein [Streptomyces acidiscabies]MBZ3909421.1 HK97 gp10 family phage protein [Streptomyces acidiscabies]MDX2962412.1 HK97 gp10 family phage protein [Streptomyces acidiscabies]MDX3792431.1 HK97 gp10 family phage protein [Streptomyces acidiscabies]